LLLDRQKEVVANYRMYSAIVFTTLLGLIAYMFNFYEKLSEIKQVFVTVGFFILVITNVYLMYKLKIETEKLKDIK